MTEFGSLVDAVLCQDCKTGGCCPLNTSPGAEWLCEECYSGMEADDIHIKIIYWRDMLDRAAEVEMKDLMSYIYQLSQIFHPNHYFILETKRRVIENISSMPGYSEGKVAEAYLQRKVDYCRHLLDVSSKVAPGYSELRAYLSNHIGTPLYWLTKVLQ